MKTFHVSLPSEIVPLTAEQKAALNTMQQQYLTHEGAVDLNLFDLYRLQLTRGDYGISSYSKRNKKHAPENLSKVLISLDIKEATGIRVISVFPTTSIIKGGTDFVQEFEFTSTVNKELLSFNTNKEGKKILDLNSQYNKKNHYYAVLAFRSPTRVQWAFFKKWITNKNDYIGELLCAVPKDLPIQNRKIMCAYDLHKGNGSSSGVGRTQEVTLRP